MGDRREGILRFMPEGASAPLSPGDTILAHAIRAGIPILSPCGGEGRCGKCRVSVSGNVRGGDDPGILSPEELMAGTRLACRCTPLGREVGVTVLPESRPARLSAYIEGKETAEDGPYLPLHVVPGKGIPLGVALDAGTSTLAGALIDLRNGSVLARAAADNPQMACGEDLISRIVFEEENPDGLALLRRLLLQGIGQVISDLLRSSSVTGEIVEIVAAGVEEGVPWIAMEFLDGRDLVEELPESVLEEAVVRFAWHLDEVRHLQHLLMLAERLHEAGHATVGAHNAPLDGQARLPAKRAVVLAGPGRVATLRGFPACHASRPPKANEAHGHPEARLPACGVFRTGV